MAQVFVFGSNTAGRHGKGSALEARQNWGAISGQGIGRQGNSYAIPTKDVHLRTLNLQAIQKYVKDFLNYAEENWTDTFTVVAIGCGLAGYDARWIGPMFKGAPKNVHLPPEFEPYR
jgi:hypothetical protein